MSNEFNSLAGEVAECKKASHQWLRDNFYDQWKAVWKSYFCERDPELDENGKPDLTQTSFGMPGTHSHVERTVHRITGQLPNVRFHAKDTNLSKLISRKIMLDWDRGGVQRQQKRHVRQGVLFGWSVRAWWWHNDQRMRKRRVDPFSPDLDEGTLAAILQQYAGGASVEQFLQIDPAYQQMMLAQIFGKHSRGNLLPIEYPYTAYHGAKSDFLYIGDCYPQPNFQSIQTSGYFIVERRRNLEWMKSIAKAFPEFADGLNRFINARPKGTGRRYFGEREDALLREEMESAIDRTSDEADYESESKYQREWVFTEMWIPGERPKLKLVGEESEWIGEIESPYELEGKIPFTELVLLDDLLCGIGNSTARIMRGIQQLHDRQVCQRVDLVYNILRPLIGTSNWELYNNPEQLKRGPGFRLVKMRGPGDMWMQQEQAAMAAVATGLQDESGIMRLYQMLTGENNMSMMSNVDPSQNRTATGAKLMQANQDVLVKGMNDMFTHASLNADAEMIYQLNRSEMSEDVEFDIVKYDRGRQRSQSEAEWVSVTPLMFQLDGEILVEAGSTIADDDEGNVAKASNLIQALAGHPNVNQRKLAEDLLIAHGKRAELGEYIVEDKEPAPEPPKLTVSIPMKWELLSEDQRNAVAKLIGLPITVPEEGAPPPQLPPGPPAQLPAPEGAPA
jgi:hypothetical protein